MTVTPLPHRPVEQSQRSVPFDPGKSGPLRGIRVLDLSRLVAGNMLSMQLGDFGADVIKIEPPSGDPLRAWKENGHSLFWKNYGRNKRSICLNLRAPGGHKTLIELIKTADVLVENFRPGTLEAMNLAPDFLHTFNPKLIVVRISGFGQTGPYAELPGFGTLVEAMSGFAARTGFPDREPVLPPLALADMIAGVYGASATAVALFARRDGIPSGQVIDLSLLEAMFSVLGPEAACFEQTGKVKERVGSASNTSAPRNVYRCKDDHYVALSGSMQAMAERIFKVIGRPELNSDPNYSTNSARVKNRREVDELVGAWFAARTRPEALAEMRAAEVTVGPVYDIQDIVDDPHFQERGVLVPTEDAELGRVTLNSIVPTFSRTPGAFRYPAPGLGEHTDIILSEIGLEPSAVEELRSQGAVK